MPDMRMFHMHVNIHYCTVHDRVQLRHIITFQNNIVVPHTVFDKSKTLFEAVQGNTELNFMKKYGRSQRK